MSGGRGTRLNLPIEKPLFKLCKKPLIKYVVDNLTNSKYIDKVFIATSPHTPKTADFIEGLNRDIFILNTPGNGYMDDLGFILDFFESQSKDDTLLFINSDLPLVSSDTIDYALEVYSSRGEDALSVSVPVSVFEELGLEYSYEFEGLVPSGMNILRSENIVQEEYNLTIPKRELAINVNTLNDAGMAEKFL